MLFEIRRAKETSRFLHNKYSSAITTIFVVLLGEKKYAR
jgi:hypothetical protein